MYIPIRVDQSMSGKLKSPTIIHLLKDDTVQGK